jgi:AbrB family looped-hinge helix DNA binding protein
MNTSRVSEKGQVTIPKTLRERLGIRAGEQVAFREELGQIVITKAPARDAVDDVTGILDLPQSTDDFIRELRGPLP